MRQGGEHRFDVTNDGSIELADLEHLIEQILNTSIGDANLDGVFNSRDLVLIFQTGEYEDGVPENSNWADGDWNCDREFSSSDLVYAFQRGNYSFAAIALNSNDVAAIMASELFTRDSDRKEQLQKNHNTLITTTPEHHQQAVDLAIPHIDEFSAQRFNASLQDESDEDLSSQGS